MIDFSAGLQAITWLCVLLLCISSLIVATAVVSYLADKYIWNKGTCRKTGQPWDVFILSDGRVSLASNGHRRLIGRWVLPDYVLA